jgi:hypothetical protein
MSNIKYNPNAEQRQAHIHIYELCLSNFMAMFHFLLVILQTFELYVNECVCMYVCVCVCVNIDR